MQWTWMSLGLIAAMVLGCGDGSGSEETVAGTSFEVEALVNGEAMSCEEVHEEVGLGGDVLRIRDFRLYIHDLVGIDEAGERRELTLVDDGRWQSEAVALLNFSDGSGHCQEAMGDERGVIEVQEEGPWTGLEFRIGVPRDHNHLDVATAQAPLNTTAMFWSWTTGYKFLRLDATIGEDQGFAFHLGSTQCEPAPHGETPECGRGHRPRVLVASAELEDQAIQIDLGHLLEGSDLSDEGARCMSEADDPGCQPLFERLGLDESDGWVQDGVFWVGGPR